jgi:thiamine biosynthesis lipoprotein
MSAPEIHVFQHNAMATQFQVRIADQDKKYAGQAAQAAFALLDHLESLLSRFNPNSEIVQIAGLMPGESLRLGEPVFACLHVAQKIEIASGGAFSVTAAARKTQPTKPQWSLIPDAFSLRCDSGKLEFDLGAIGKGFALDRQDEILREWDCPAFLLVAGGSSVLAGASPAGTAGWSCGLGENNSSDRFWLTECSLSGSGLAVKGSHILNPRTGAPPLRTERTWALADTAAESDALSTAAMVQDETEIQAMVATCPDWLIIRQEQPEPKYFGSRKRPEKV